MKKVFLTISIILICHICSAPVLDLEMRIFRLRALIESTEKEHHEREFRRLIDDLGFRESGNDWTCINSIGCFGEWQFSESTLRYLGFRKITLRKFRANPEIFPREVQLEALKGLIKVNLSSLKNYNHFIGDTIKGVQVTKAGMIAASHLGGAGSLIKFLNSGGKINKTDALGTSIHDYLRIFSNYELE